MQGNIFSDRVIEPWNNLNHGVIDFSFLKPSSVHYRTLISLRS